jgi:uncharacterized membrane protein YbhN (UPF0104 family)
VSPATRQWINRLLLVAGAALLVYLVSRFPLADIADACAKAGPGIAITPVVAMGWFSCGARSLYNLLDGAVPFRALVYNRLVGEGYNALLPAAGVGGEPFKLQLLHRYVPARRGVVALIDDRLVENAIAFLFSAACVGAGAATLDVDPALHATMVLYAVGATVAAAACAVMLFTSLTSRLGGRIARWIGHGRDHAHRTPPAAVARAFGWTLLARLCGLVEIAILYKLLGIDASLADIAFTGGAVAAAGFVGGVVPQGLGVTEAATVGIFELLHFDPSLGVAFALARRGRQLLTSIAGVVLHAATRRRG